MGLLPTPTQGPPLAQPQGQPQGQPPADQQGQGDEQPNVSPEEQQQYDTVMKQAASIIYGKGKVMPAILDALKPAKDAPQAPANGAPSADGDGTDPENGADASQDAPQTTPGDDGDGADTEDGADQQQDTKGNPAVLALANTATQIVSKLDASAKQQNYPISDDVLYHAGSEIVSMLAEVAEAAGFHNYTEDEINGAFYQAVDNYRPIAEEMGRTNNDQLKQQFGDIMTADQQGQLGQLLPGIDQAPGGSAPPAQQ